MTVVTMRSYSRISGDTSWEQVTRSPRVRSTAATARSWAGSRSACRRQTATPETSAGTSGTASRSTGSSSSPSAPKRPPTSNRRARGTSGSGLVTALS